MHRSASREPLKCFATDRAGLRPCVPPRGRRDVPHAGEADQLHRFLRIARHQPAFKRKPAQHAFGAGRFRSFQQGQRTLRIGHPAFERHPVLRMAGKSRMEDVSLGQVIGGKRLSLKVDQKAPLRNPMTYKVVGKPLLRTDVPAKCTGRRQYVHDVKLPGMLHARVVRPPALGAKLLSVDEASQMIADSRKAALAMFPGKELAYDLIWRPRFQRLMRERFRIM